MGGEERSEQRWNAALPDGVPGGLSRGEGRMCLCGCPGFVWNQWETMFESCFE